MLSQRPDLADATRTYVARARVPSTERAYAADWHLFTTWCEAHGVSALPADVETIVAFLVDQAGEVGSRGVTKALATLRRYRATVSKAHRRAGLASPAYDARVLEVLRGIAVEKGERSLFAKNAATADVFIPMLAKLGRERAKDIRDRAILLFGLMSSLRRAEIVAVNIEDLKWIDEGIAVLVRRSKTDRAGVGRTLLVPRAENPELCPVRAMRAWLDLVGETRGPLFRSLWKTGRPRRTGRLPAEQVADIVKRVALAAGLDPVLFGGHSLRAGYVTQARRTGLSWEAIMEQTGHKKIETVKRYARDAIDSSRTSRVVEVMKSFEGPETPESLTRIVEEVVLRPSD